MPYANIEDIRAWKRADYAAHAEERRAERRARWAKKHKPTEEEMPFAATVEAPYLPTIDFSHLSEEGLRRFRLHSATRHLTVPEVMRVARICDLSYDRDGSSFVLRERSGTRQSP